MYKILVYVGIIGLVIIAALLGYNIYQQQSISNPSSVENLPPVDRTIETGDSKASPTPEAVTYKPNEGIIDSINITTLVLKSGGTNQTYSVAQTQDFQRILSGTFDGGNGVYQQAARTDLKAGQHVLLIVPQDSKNVTTVFILK